MPASETSATASPDAMPRQKFRARACRVVIVIGRQRCCDAVMIEQLSRDAGILAGNHVGAGERFQRADGDVAQISDRGRDEIETRALPRRLKVLPRDEETPRRRFLRHVKAHFAMLLAWLTIRRQYVRLQSGTPAGLVRGRCRKLAVLRTSRALDFIAIALAKAVRAGLFAGAIAALPGCAGQGQARRPGGQFARRRRARRSEPGRSRSR